MSENNPKKKAIDLQDELFLKKHITYDRTMNKMAVENNGQDHINHYNAALEINRILDKLSLEAKVEILEKFYEENNLFKLYHPNDPSSFIEISLNYYKKELELKNAATEMVDQKNTSSITSFAENSSKITIIGSFKKFCENIYSFFFDNNGNNRDYQIKITPADLQHIVYTNFVDKNGKRFLLKTIQQYIPIGKPENKDTDSE